MNLRKLLLALTACLVAAPAMATTIPSVASGEAQDREAALNSALRHAVEQVVGMSVGTTTYVSNLKTIEDKIYSSANGFIEKYEVVSEDRTLDGGYRLTVSAKVSKEKLSSAVSPLIGGGVVNLNGQLSLANLQLALKNQRDTERAFKGWLDELPGPALVFSYKTREHITTSNPDVVRIYFDNFKARFDEGWYKRYRKFHAQVAAKTFAAEVFQHARTYSDGINGYLSADLYDADGEVLETHSILGGYSVASAYAGVAREIVNDAPPPVVPPDLNNTNEKYIEVKALLLPRIKKIRVRNPRNIRGWPVLLE
jgi:hypothetical protein